MKKGNRKNIKDVTWKIKDNVTLVHILEGNESVLSAEGIISAQFIAENEVKPTDVLSDLTFSKNVLKAKLIILASKSAEFLKIKGKIHLSNLLSKTSIFTEQLSQNHLIDSGTWYPIISEDVEDIKTILDLCEISKLNNITLKSYLKLKRIQGFESIIEFQEEELDITEEAKARQPELMEFNATLYPYQVTGFRWLSRFSEESFGCILADEMGLGKTIQVIALLHNELNNSPVPSLIVCPSSLLINWQREFRKFSPITNIYLHVGSSRTGFPDVLRRYDVIITSYDIAVRDLSLLEQINWNFLVCDEAQAVKNPDAKRTQYIKLIPKRVCIAVTGTPFENRLLDIWSIIDLVAKDLLGDKNNFLFEFPDGIQSARKLEPLISPIMLRRRVDDVAKDLPERIDIPQPISMDEKLIGYYEDFRTDILNRYGTKASLVSIQLLRMFCCEPSLALKDGINYDSINNKYQRLKEILLEIFKTGEKALIFTSYLQMADKIITSIETDLKCYVNYIDGRVNIEERQNIIDQFSEVSGTAFLVLNPKAAGTGLNITAANHVIHYNLEWNPSVEDQASARAYRRGQARPVFIYRLFYVDTIDEYIDSKVEQKRNISEKSVIGVDGESELAENIYKALQYSPEKNNE